MTAYPERVGYLLKERVVNVATLVGQLARLARASALSTVRAEMSSRSPCGDGEGLLGGNLGESSAHMHHEFRTFRALPKATSLES